MGSKYFGSILYFWADNFLLSILLAQSTFSLYVTDGEIGVRNNFSNPKGKQVNGRHSQMYNTLLY